MLTWLGLCQVMVHGFSLLLHSPLTTSTLPQGSYIHLTLVCVSKYLSACLPLLSASRSSDKTVNVWDACMRECCHTFKDHSDQVGLANGCPMLFPLATPSTSLHPLQVWCVTYNDSGTKVASVSDDKSLLVYNCLL